jgi:hypothetical protein
MRGALEAALPFPRVVLALHLMQLDQHVVASVAQDQPENLVERQRPERVLAPRGCKHDGRPRRIEAQRVGNLFPPQRAVDQTVELRETDQLRDAGTAGAAAALERSGFGGTFLRPVFHGVGIEHEEAPIPGGHAVIHGEEKVEQVQAGMVLAIGNCGIYRDDFGVRAEDAVWVSERGPIPLTTYPKTPAGPSR